MTGLDAIKDVQTVTAGGEPVATYIAGVQVRRTRTHQDERGELCEVYDPAWGFTAEPMVYAYQAMIRPGMAKGWILHEQQDDRLFISFGTAKVVLYDAREGSETRGMLNEVYLGERDRGIVVIPRGVWHAVENVGSGDLYYLNLPTKAYNHASPDKYRLPLDTDQIPYRFEGRRGW
ncbi:MAG: dTDP-4-dehydrorhamnose 3,5-epimerase [Chloroflexota bacterium]|jgi:dTDP-4-dehydrorhamnose 3,5-epimerase|nr:dTDP-4-dehydrorhamnose 3,5-epimerase [Chloroflexota bacterium]